MHFRDPPRALFLSFSLFRIYLPFSSSSSLRASFRCRRRRRSSSSRKVGRKASLVSTLLAYTIKHLHVLACVACVLTYIDTIRMRASRQSYIHALHSRVSLSLSFSLCHFFAFILLSAHPVVTGELYIHTETRALQWDDPHRER